MASTMSPFARYLRKALRSLGIWGVDDYVVFGSAVMRLHGLRDEIGDVDILVSQRDYARLRESGKWTELRPREDDPPLLEARRPEHTFNAFYTWTSRDSWVDVPEAFALAEEHDGLTCVPLSLVARWKQGALANVRSRGVEIEGSPWEKHVHDLRALSSAGAT